MANKGTQIGNYLYIEESPGKTRKIWNPVKDTGKKGRKFGSKKDRAKSKKGPRIKFDKDRSRIESILSRVSGTEIGLPVKKEAP